MSEMVERVARAMCVADGLDPDADWRVTDKIMLMVAVKHPERWRTYERRSRAAIEAMREPTDEMLFAAFYRDGKDHHMLECMAAWRGMIDEALK